MITEKITILWRGKELSECTKEELIECIYELRRQYKNANVGTPTTGKWDIPHPKFITDNLIGYSVCN